jgi:acyl-CoA synthetase (AMP-forming)/AMP-acid ligase II
VNAPPEMTLDASARRHAELRPDKSAISCEGRELSFLQLHRETSRIARKLLSEGVKVGDRIAYLGFESELLYMLALAGAKTGAVFIPVNWRLTEPEIDHILRDSGAVAVFAESAFLPKITALRSRLPKLRTVVDIDGPGGGAHGLQEWLYGSSAVDLHPVASADDPVIQIYTSGTTGLPKGVVLAHRSFYTLPRAVGDQGDDWIDWRTDDVSLISLPGFGIAGLSWFMHGFAVGATNVVMRMWVSEEAIRLIADRAVTITFVAPTMLRLMLDEPAARPAAFRSLRKVAYGAAPITTELLRRSLEVFGCDFAQIYASTETGSVAVCLPPSAHVPGSKLLNSAGKACPGNELKIIRDDGTSVSPGEIGQVCIRTPAHMVEYWNNPEATARTLVDGWVRMGDAGYLDEQGYLFLADRINDTIISAGQNIYPAEVEKAICGHPAVADAGVVSTPHPLWGQAVHAFIALRPGESVTPRQLTLFLRGRLADYKIPTCWEFVSQLPRNPGGKVLRRVLREQAAATSEGGSR